MKTIGPHTPIIKLCVRIERQRISQNSDNGRLTFYQTIIYVTPDSATMSVYNILLLLTSRLVQLLQDERNRCKSRLRVYATIRHTTHNVDGLTTQMVKPKRFFLFFFVFTTYTILLSSLIRQTEVGIFEVFFYFSLTNSDKFLF